MTINTDAALVRRITDALVRFPKLTCLICGAASATGFAPFNLWVVTLVAFALLLHLVNSAPNRAAALSRGYWFGIGHFIVGMNWIAGAFRFQDSMPVWLGWVAVVLLAFYLALYPAVSAGLAWRHARRSPSGFVLVFAAAWLVTEWLRATLFTGYAWNPLGVVSIDLGAVPGLSAYVGTYGLSAILCLVAGGLWLMLGRNWRTGLALIAPLTLSLLPARSTVTSAALPPAPLIRVIQPNIGQDAKYDPEHDAAGMASLERLTGAPGSEPRLILWPEAAVPDFLEQEVWARARVASMIGPNDVLLTGGDALVYDKKGKLTGARNSVFAVMPDASLFLRYDKSHLVPYGEYLPMRALLSSIGLSRLVPGDLDFLPGQGPQSYIVPGVGKVGIQICYEIVFSGHVVDRENRPQFLFNPSNDAWFGSWGPPQHLAQARLRAIEEAMPIIRSTPTGISAVIDADGRIVASLPFQKAGFIQTRLPPPRAPTLFAQWGNILSIAFAIFLSALGVALGRKRR